MKNKIIGAVFFFIAVLLFLFTPFFPFDEIIAAGIAGYFGFIKK